ncbi:MAG: M10 family metallopeptidase C-terminal domain-containing protein [Pseudomonadota bacterium]
MTRTFDPARHLNNPDSARITETTDAAGNIFTVYGMDVGDTFRGNLTFRGDRDWVEISLDANTSYDITLSGQESGGGLTLLDPFLRVYNSSGTLVSSNDDAGFGTFESGLTFTTGSTGGTFYISAGAYEGQYGDGDPLRTGTYEIGITTAGAPPPPPPPASVGTLDELAEFLTEGYWGGREHTFSTTNITVNLTALTTAGQQLARMAMDNWEMVSNLRFTEVTSGEMISLDDEADGAFAYRPGSGNVPNGVELNFNRQFMFNNGTDVNSLSLLIMTHEFGHAIGLGHQGGYNSQATYGIDNTFINDSWAVSIMSYFDQRENTSTTDAYALVGTTQISDILAIQNLYGENRADNVTVGNTIWGQGSAFGTHVDTMFANMVGGTYMAFTVYDQSGIDTLNFGFTTQANDIDLNDEARSDINGLAGLMAIARGTMIENATTGSGNDVVTGNEVANQILLNIGNDSATGGAGNDTINGGIGFDTLEGGGGRDSLVGDNGADLLRGGDDNDILNGGNGFDNLYGDAGNDTILAGSSADRAWGGDGADVIRGGTNVGLSRDGLFGEGGNDRIFGEGGFDEIDGGDGNDFLDGGAQADNIFGRAGNDTMLGGQGLDRLFGGTGDDLGRGGTENDGMFGNEGNDTLFGEAGNDNFFGGSGNDSLDGGTGNDTINAGAGFDTINGGAGDDILFGRFNADIFVFEDGHGSDEIWDFQATNSLERIDFSGLSTINTLAQLNLGSATAGLATQVGNAVLIQTGGSNTILLQNVNIADLDATDFIF